MGVLPLPPPHNPKMHHHLVALALIALAGKLGVGLLGGGYLLSRRGRGKRSALQEEVTLEQLAALEVDDCYKRLFCSAAAGGLGGVVEVEDLLLLVGPDASQVNSELRAPGSKQAERIRQAAIFGMSRRDVAKCEHHFQCSVKTSDIVRMFSEDS